MQLMIGVLLAVKAFAFSPISDDLAVRQLLLPLLGGSIGALLGMRTFRHKTKHWYFVWGIPAILLAQIALAVWLLYR